VFVEAGDDPDSDTIVITGAGVAFSSGGDLEWLNGQLADGLTPFVIESRTNWPAPRTRDPDSAIADAGVRHL
jgi:enoyl-CoA hydratase/carnithine racemase